MELASAARRLQTWGARVRTRLPWWPGAPRTQAPERFVVDGPLDVINDEFHEAYEESKGEARREVPVFVVLADELIVFFRGQRVAYSFAPRSFHVIKSVTHAPLAIYAALFRLDGAALDVQARERLAAQRARIDEALARVDQDAGELDRATREDLRAILRACADFLADDLERVPLARLSAFARPLGPVLLRLADAATALQLDALHRHVERAVSPFTREEREALQVVVAGDHQARARSLAMQYFQKRLGEPAGVEQRVSYAEGVSDERGALSLVGTRRLDHALGSSFFDNAFRLQRDILGDSAKARLAQLELPLLGQA